MDPVSPNTILCTSMGFYPVEFQWVKNRWPEEDLAFGEELQNRDWTY